ncbi:hypothetical protein [Natrinema sp. DC36]|uniref:hypothetical protein n=1 Tax=Natrinema sp. DC36 TaxID=2878680 RepID=UPI001CF083B5|nr:hypothetical protein [Natrinema sp. DC36]
MTRNNLQKRINELLDYHEEHRHGSTAFQLGVLMRAREQRDDGGDSMMVEEVKAIEKTALALHRLVTNDAFPFEALEDALDNMGVVYDEQMEMLKMRENDD